MERLEAWGAQLIGVFRDTLESVVTYLPVVLTAVAVLVTLLLGATVAAWLVTGGRQAGELDTDLGGVSVSEATATTPPPTPPKEEGDRRCWTVFGGGPRRALARPAATLGLPARKSLWTTVLDSYIEFPPVYCDGELFVNSEGGTTYAFAMLPKSSSSIVSSDGVSPAATRSGVAMFPATFVTT